MRYPRMVRLFDEKGIENLTTLALIGKGLVGLGRGDVQGQSVEDRGFGVVRIGRL